MTPNEMMLTAILDCPRIDLYTKQTILQSEDQKVYEEMQNRYANGEPLQYIIGFTEFFGTKIFVDPQVLIPRPETEIMTEHAAHFLKTLPETRTLRVLDIGTGSGNIAVSLARCIHNVEVTAVDVSPLALSIAKQNAHVNQVENKVTFVCEDMRDFLKYNDRSVNYDLIISNPPYIPTMDLTRLPSDVKQEPRLALDGGPDGLQFYRYIIDHAGDRLKEGGCLYFEVGDDQAADVTQLLSTESWLKTETVKDYVGTERVVRAVKKLSISQTTCV